jgi:hypothetical protein
LSRNRYEILVSRTSVGFQVDAQALLAEPAPVRRRVVLMALRCAVSSHEYGLDHVESVLAVASGETGAIDVPGARVELQREKLVLLRHSA